MTASACKYCQQAQIPYLSSSENTPRKTTARKTIWERGGEGGTGKKKKTKKNQKRLWALDDPTSPPYLHEVRHAFRYGKPAACLGADEGTLNYVHVHQHTVQGLQEGGILQQLRRQRGGKRALGHADLVKRSRTASL